MTVFKRLIAKAVNALAGSVLIALNLRWLAQARRWLLGGYG